MRTVVGDSRVLARGRRGSGESRGSHQWSESTQEDSSCTMTSGWRESSGVPEPSGWPRWSDLADRLRRLVRRTGLLAPGSAGLGRHQIREIGGLRAVAGGKLDRTVVLVVVTQWTSSPRRIYQPLLRQVVTRSRATINRSVAGGIMTAGATSFRRQIAVDVLSGPGTADPDGNQRRQPPEPLALKTIPAELTPGSRHRPP